MESRVERGPIPVKAEVDHIPVHHNLQNMLEVVAGAEAEVQ